MTDKQINERIAVICGWKRPEDCMELKQGWTMPHVWWLSPKGKLELSYSIPNYANDLNAMHEAEETMLQKHGGYYQIGGAGRYAEAIEEIIGSLPFNYIHMKARIRAEAFLRAHNQWEEA